VNTLLSFYTLLRVVPNPASGEAVVVGLVLFDGERHTIRVSMRRKLRLAIMLAPQAAAAIRFGVRQLEGRVEQDTAARRLALVTGEAPDSTKLIHQTDWEYLSKYMNGLVQVDAPQAVMLFAGEEPLTVFNQLYETLVSADELSKRERKTQELVKMPVRTLIQRVKTQVHTNVVLTPKLLPDLFFNLRLDCVGMNGSLIGAHSLPLEQLSIDTLQQHYNECWIALKSLNQHYKPKNPAHNKIYLLADEPDPIADADKHKFWQAIQGEETLRVLRTDEAELVADQIERTGATKFLKEEATQQQTLLVE
jgi:hypothetical protein